MQTEQMFVRLKSKLREDKREDTCRRVYDLSRNMCGHVSPSSVRRQHFRTSAAEVWRRRMADCLKSCKLQNPYLLQTNDG
jgi:hypothetical protein